MKLQNITDEAVFFLDGASRFDFSQGVVGEQASAPSKEDEFIN